MELVWSDIPGYEGRYKVSNTGLVKSCEHFHPVLIRGAIVLRHRKEQLLKQWKRSSYLLVDLWKDGERDVRSVHVLVYEAFKEALKEDEVVHHKDGNRFNNSVENLVKMTQLEHNRLHHSGKPSWNKGLKTPPEVHQKAWETRRKNNESK